MEAEEVLYDSSYRIDTAVLSKGIKKIRRNSIRHLGENLCASLGLVNEMIALPSKLLALLHFERSVVFYETKALILAKLGQSREDDFEEQYQKELDKVLESEFKPKAEKIAEGAVEVGKSMFKQMIEKDEIGLRGTYDGGLVKRCVKRLGNSEYLLLFIFLNLIYVNAKVYELELLRRVQLAKSLLREHEHLPDNCCGILHLPVSFGCICS